MSADPAAFDLVDEVGIGHGARAHRGLVATEEVEQRKDQHEQHDPEGDVSRVTQGISSKRTWPQRRTVRVCP